MLRYILTIITTAIIVCAAASSQAFAVESTTTQNNTQSAAQTEQTRLAAIKTKGSQEIDRRVAALTKVNELIDKSSKLSDANKTALKAEVSKTMTELTSLKTKLAANTTLTEARTDAKAILTEYRVFALLMPKIHLIKVIDGQLALETKFTELSANFMERLAQLKTAGKDTSALEATLSNMATKVASAQEISNSVQAKMIALQPTDYNNDHSVLSGYRDQLKTARESLVSARADAKSLVNGIKELTL